MKSFALIALLLASPLAADNPMVTPLPVPAVTGSMSPNLSTGHAGTIVLSWQEPGDAIRQGQQGGETRLQFSRLEPAGWSTPRTVASSSSWFVNWADFPSVVAVSDTLWAAHWLQKRPGGTYSYDVSVALSTNQGRSWQPAITPHRDGTPTEHGFVSLYPADGELGLVWLDGRNTLAASTGESNGQGHDAGHSSALGGGMTLRHARIAADGRISAEAELDGLVCDCCQTRVALTNQGPVAIYRNRTGDEIRDIYLTRFVNGAWQPGRAVHDDGWRISACPVNGPALATHGDTVAVAWFTLAGDVARVRLARSSDGGESFGAAVEIAETTPLGRVDVVLLDDGHAVVSWLDQDATGVGSLKLRAVTATGETYPPFTLAGMESGRPGGFPQMAAAGPDLILAWTASDAGASRITAARVSRLAVLPAGSP